MRNNGTLFCREDMSSVTINILLLGKEGFKRIKRRAEHTLVGKITEDVTVIYLKKLRDLNYK